MANKTAVIAFRSRADGTIRLETLRDEQQWTIKDAARRAITPGTTLFSDGQPAYRDIGYQHH